MELARRRKWRIREATEGDASAISRLLGTATLRHLHLDWHLPVDWLGAPGFALCEKVRAQGEPDLVACLAVGADPPPAAWVRVAAVKGDIDADDFLRKMLGPMLPWLQENGVTIIGWLQDPFWRDRWLEGAGFRRVNWIVTYGMELTDTLAPADDLPSIRPVTPVDMPRLAEIEALAFEPLWRHSQQGLLRAFAQAISFDVAEQDGEIVGFQYSVAGQDDRSAHLVRLTVAPQTQGHGVGSSLVRAAFRGYARMGRRRITLNTQADNYASHKLYERFGFQRLTGRAAVWAMEIG